MPAILANRYRDVLAANPIARALSPEFTPGQNSLRWRLLDPAARQFYVNWDEATEIVVSGLRELSGTCPNDPRMRALIAELSDASPRFRELWGRAEVGYRLGFTTSPSSSRRTISLPPPAKCTVSRWGRRAHLSRRARKRFRQSVGGTPVPVGRAWSQDTLRTGTWLTPGTFRWLTCSTRCSTRTADLTTGGSSAESKRPSSPEENCGPSRASPRSTAEADDCRIGPRVGIANTVRC